MKDKTLLSSLYGDVGVQCAMDIAATQDEAEKFLGKFIDIDVNKFHFDIPATADVDSYIKQLIGVFDEEFRHFHKTETPLSKQEMFEILYGIVKWKWSSDQAWAEYCRILVQKCYNRSKDKNYYWVTVPSAGGDGSYRKVVCMCPEQVKERYPGRYKKI